MNERRDRGLEEELEVDGLLHEGNELPCDWDEMVTAGFTSEIKEKVEYLERRMRDLDRLRPRIKKENAPICSDFMEKIYTFRREINVEIKRLDSERYDLVRDILKKRKAEMDAKMALRMAKLRGE